MAYCGKCLHLDVCKTTDSCDGHVPRCKHFMDKDEHPKLKHGRWIAVPSSDMMTGKAYKCSECNKMRYGSYHPSYCQCCGAKMDGGNEDG